jgi:hypothetical protein
LAARRGKAETVEDALEKPVQASPLDLSSLDLPDLELPDPTVIDVDSSSGASHD